MDGGGVLKLMVDKYVCLERSIVFVNKQKFSELTNFFVNCSEILTNKSDNFMNERKKLKRKI